MARKFLCYLAVLFSVISTPVLATDDKELIFLTWSEYIDPEIVAEFEAKHGIKVNFVYFESDEARDRLMVETDAKGYDLMLVNGSSLAAYDKRGWLAPVNQSHAENMKHIDQTWLSKYPSAMDRAAPYFWGTLGIVYRADHVKEPFTHWKQLFEPDETLKGKIVIINDSRDMIGMALKSLGYSFNSSSGNELKEAKRLLLNQKPFVYEYSYPILTEESSLITGEISAAMVYSGDALALQEHSDEIEYVVPQEGTSLWIDFITVSQNSKNKQAAYKFINFINQPKISARNAEYVYFATPNKAAEALLPEDFLSNTSIYPAQDVIDRSEFESNISARGMKKRNSIYQRIVE